MTVDIAVAPLWVQRKTLSPDDAVFGTVGAIAYSPGPTNPANITVAEAPPNVHAGSVGNNPACVDEPFVRAVAGKVDRHTGRVSVIAWNRPVKTYCRQLPRTPLRDSFRVADNTDKWTIGEQTRGRFTFQ